MKPFRKASDKWTPNAECSPGMICGAGLECGITCPSHQMVHPGIGRRKLRKASGS